MRPKIRGSFPMLDKAGKIPKKYLPEVVESATTAPGIINTAEGTTITLPDSAEAPLQGLKVYGKSEQETINGYQLFDISQIQNDAITVNDDGSISVSLTGFGSTTIDISYVRSLLKIGNLNIKCHYVADTGLFPIECATIRTTSSLGEITDTATAVDTLAEGGTLFNFPNDTAIGDLEGLSLKFTDMMNGDAATYTFKLMLYQDGDGTWEPYTGGEVSLNPNYPQEIISVCEDSGSVDVKVQGKNLLEYEAGTTVSKNGGTVVVNDDMSVTASGTTTDYIGLILYNGEAIHEDLTFGCDGLTATTNIALSVELRKDGALINTKTITSLSGTNSLIIAKSELTDIDTLIVSLKRAANNATMTGTVYPIMTVGDYDGVYDPPKALQSATFETPMGLRSIPGTDIRDEIDLERGVRVQRVCTIADAVTAIENGEITLNSCWYNDGISYNQILITSPVITYAILSNCFQNTNDWNTLKTVPNMCYTASRSIYFSVEAEKIGIVGTEDSTTLRQLVMQWLSNTFPADNPLIFNYGLATPIETPLTDEEIEAYKALHTYKPNTTIYNSEGAEMSVDYVADTKNYIDNKIEKAVAELSAAIITE